MAQVSLEIEKVNWRPVKTALGVYSKPKAIHAIIYRNSPAWHQLWNSRIKTSTVFAENSSDQLNVVCHESLKAVRTTYPVASEFGIRHNAVRDGVIEILGKGDLVDEKSPALRMQ